MNIEQIVDLSIYELNKNEFDKINKNIKKNIKENIIGYIFTNKINELYNLDQNKNKWIIKYNKILFILDFTSYVKNNETIQIIRIRHA